MGDSHCTKLLPNSISGPNFVTNHESVCLSSVEADIVYKCVNNDVMLSPDHFIGIPTERFNTVYDKCEANSDSCASAYLIGLANFDTLDVASELHNPITQACFLNHPPHATELCALSAVETKQTSVPDMKSDDKVFSPNLYESIIVNQSLPHSNNTFDCSTDDLLQVIDDGSLGESDVWYMNAKAKPNVKDLVKWSILTNTIKYSSVKGSEGKLLSLTSYHPAVNSKALRDNHLDNYSPPDYLY